MNKILVTHIEKDTSSKEIHLEIPANNALELVIVKKDKDVTIDIFAILK